MTSKALHNYERIQSDAYYTIEAPRAIQVLNAATPISGKVLEPAAGAGHLSNELQNLPAVIGVVSSDIEPHWTAPHVYQCPIEMLPPDPEVNWVITNLPFNAQDELIAHLLDLHPQARHAYMVLAAYLFPKKRNKLIHTNPRFAGVVGFTKRLKWFLGGSGSPAVDYVWLCFAPSESATSVPFIKFEGGK